MARSRSPLRLGDCSFEPPSDWTSQVVATGPIESGFRPSFVVHSVPSLKDEDSEDYAARILPDVQKNGNNFELLFDGPAMYGDVKGWLREHAYDFGGRRVGQMHFYVVSHGVARSFIFTHLASHLELRRGAAEHFFATIRLFPAVDRMKFEGGVRI